MSKQEQYPSGSRAGTLSTHAARRPFGGGVLLRDQQRALHAYERVSQVPKEVRRDYETAINDLGANIRQSGLAAAMAALERVGSRGMLVREHLASAGVPGLAGATKDTLPDCVRKLSVDNYMLATRDMLQIAAWLKRAAQASFGGN